MNPEIHLKTDDLVWEATPSTGVFYKSLRYDKETKSGAVLIRMDAESDYPEHEHTRGEEFLVLDGELILEGKSFPRGSYVYSPPGSIHHPTTKNGCLLFAVFHGKIVNIE